MRTDISGWSTRLTDEIIARNTESGIWRNRTLADELAALAARDPDRVLFVEGGRSHTVADMDRMARALASALQARGLGDVLSFGVPNWPETVAIDLACAMLGLVCNPIIPIYTGTPASRSASPMAAATFPITLAAWTIAGSTGPSFGTRSAGRRASI